MRKYLSTLHQRPERHKKNFALMVSGLATLLIFSLWSFVHLHDGADTVAETVTSESDTANALSPVSGLKETFTNSLQSLKDAAGQARQGLKQVDIQSGYTEVRNEALNNGQ